MNIFITNEKSEKIALKVEGLENKANKKLAFIQHGLSGHKGQAMVRMPAKAFLDNGYVVVTFDSRYSFGDSDGELENSTLTTFIEDLKTVINWAKEQDFYAEPFALSGHSLGGGSVIKYSQDNPNNVSLLVPVAPMVGGKYFIRSRILYDGKNYRKWQQEGKVYREHKNGKEKSGYISFDVVRDMINYDLVRDAPKLKAKTLMITGDKDVSSTVYNNNCLYFNTDAPKQLIILEDCAHLYESQKNQDDLYNVINEWLKQNV